MEIYACGLNSHNQLALSTDSRDVTTFLKIMKGKRLRVLCAVWSAIIIEVDEQLFYQGYYQSGPKSCNISYSKDIKSIFGDIEGIQGALTTDSNFSKLVPNDSCSDPLKFQRSQQNWHRDQDFELEHIAIAGNGQVAIVAHEKSKCNEPWSINLGATSTSFLRPYIDFHIESLIGGLTESFLEVWPLHQMLQEAG